MRPFRNPIPVEMTDREEIKAVERTEEITGEGDGKEDFDWNSYLEDYGPTGVRYDRKDDDGAVVG